MKPSVQFLYRSLKYHNDNKSQTHFGNAELLQISIQMCMCVLSFCKAIKGEEILFLVYHVTLSSILLLKEPTYEVKGQNKH